MGDMADFTLWSHFDMDEWDAEAQDNYHRKSDNSSRYYYSRITAWCRNCGIQYKNLHPLVRVTARLAREDGWEIKKAGKGYIWLCPRCRVLSDFSGLE